jgi:uncharacterized protein (TIGR03435 family)
VVAIHLPAEELQTTSPMPPSRKPSPGRRVGLPEVCVALAGLVSVMPTPAQSPVSRREFEVASIRLNVKGGPWVFNGQKSPGTFAAENQTLRALIQEAYGVPSGKRNWLPVFVAAGTGTPILGGPDWIGSARYDITAKWNAAPDAYRTVESINKTQVEMDLMLRALLEQRFHLKLHRVTREMPVYELRIAKAGKLRQGTCATYNPANPPLSTPDPQPVIYCGGSSLGRKGLDWTLDGAGMKTADLANTLSFLIGTRTVIDKTGFAGTFDAHLRWTPGLGEFGATHMPPSPDDVNESIFTVLQEQLGLTLKAARGPVEVIVVDRAERPSEN